MENSLSKDSKFCDIIYELSRKLLDHVAEDILSDLDVDDLKNAELVSKGWQQTVLQSRAWSKILHKKVSESALWRRAFHGFGNDFYTWNDKKKCLAILDSFKAIDRNWRAGKCRLTKHVSETFQLAPSVTLCCTSHSFQMNARYIFPAVGPLNHWNTIAFSDRETMQISKVVHLRNVLYHCEANETLAFFGYYDGIMSVFDIDSGQEVHQLRELEGSAIVGLKIHRNTLVTLSFIDGPNPEDKLLTIWNVESPTVVHLTAQIPLKVWTARVEIDEQFIIVLADNGAYVISRETNELLKKIDFQPQTIEAQYSNGVLVTLELMDQFQNMRFTYVSAGTSLQLYKKIEPHIVSFRINSKFIVALGMKGTLQIIDFKQAMQDNFSWNRLVLATVETESAEIFAYQVDDFQVVLFNGLLICLDFTNWIRKPVENEEAAAS